MRTSFIRGAAGVAAAVAIGVGAAAVSGAGSTTEGAGARGDGTVRPGAGAMRGPRGEAVARDVAERVSAAVRTAHPGTVERVVQAPDGGFLAFVSTDDGRRLLVRVSATYEVLDAVEGGRGGGSGPGAAPEPGGVPDATTVPGPGGAPDGPAPAIPGGDLS